jgi:hypothetical protein
VFVVHLWLTLLCPCTLDGTPGDIWGIPLVAALSAHVKARQAVVLGISSAVLRTHLVKIKTKILGFAVPVGGRVNITRP